MEQMNLMELENVNGGNGINLEAVLKLDTTNSGDFICAPGGPGGANIPCNRK